MQKHIRENGNVIYGDLEQFDKIKITFIGKNNILFLTPKCRLKNSSICFGGDNALVFLGDSTTLLNITLHSNCLFYGGNNNYYNPAGPRTFLISERKNIIIGNNCLYSHTIWFRNADPHLIYDSDTNKRINLTKSIYIGDHVWFGQEIGVTKGVFVASGSIIGAKSMLTKNCLSNTVNAGNPIREVKNNIFWLNECVHNWDEDKTKIYDKVDGDQFKYTYNQDEFLSPKAIEEKLDPLNTAQEKLEFIYDAIYCNKNKNRFAYFKDMPYDIPLPKYENKFKSLKFEEIDEAKPQPTPPAPKPTPQPTPQELEIKSLKDKLSQKEKDINNLDINHKKALTSQELEIKSLKEALSKKENDINNLELNYQKALNTKNHLSYKLGQALIKANKTGIKVNMLNLYLKL